MNKQIICDDINTSEQTCVRCGICCHPCVNIGVRKIIINEIHCKYLKKIKNNRQSLLNQEPAIGSLNSVQYECAVYDRRFQVAPWCLTLTKAIDSGMLAQNCPYVKNIKQYSGKFLLSNRLLNQYYPQLEQHFLLFGIPDWCDVYDALSFFRCKVSWKHDKDRFLFKKNE